ncbi:MAG: hypothetical protein R3E60_06740 [Alphaproteobacteria bacterium]
MRHWLNKDSKKQGDTQVLRKETVATNLRKLGDRSPYPQQWMQG